MVDPVGCDLSRRALLILVGLPLVNGVAGCVGRGWEDLPASTLTMATGNPGGVFHRYGRALAATLERRLPDLTVQTRETNASVQNLRLVAAGKAHVGLSLGDAASDAMRGTGEFATPLDVVALARTYDSFVHVVVRSDSPITDLDGLRGQRVGLGAPGSGTRVLAQRILAQAGLRVHDVEVSGGTLGQSAEALRTGAIDAFFFVSGLPNSAVQALSRDVAIRLLDLGGLVRGMTRSYGPEYTAGPVPASTYGLPDETETVSVKNYVVVRADMSERLAYAVTRVVFEGQETVERLAPGVRQPNVGAAIFTSPLELHPGAVRYYRERHP